MLIVRRFAPQEWRTYRELRLRALADSPDAFGSTLAVEEAGSEGEWRRRLEEGARSATDLPLVAERDGRPVGLAWGRMDAPGADVAHLYQVWVAPDHRGHGIGRRLVEVAIEWAREVGAQSLALDVTCGDGAAIRLYSRAGFRDTGERQFLRPGSALMTQSMRLALGAEQSIAFTEETSP